jgi:hypothetical protein
LLLLCVAFVLALNAIPSITFPVVASGAFVEMPRAMIGHFVATATVDAFVFFSVTTLQGVIILALGRGAAAKLSPVAQTFAVVGILLTLLFIGGIRVVTAEALLRGDPADPLLAWNPAAWFLGLYEFIAGSPRPLMGGLAARALVAGMVPSAATLAIYAFGYKRLLKRAVETPSRSTRSILTTAGSRIVRLVFIRRPEEQAIAAFLLRGIARSGRHSLLLSIYTGAGLALMITFVLPAALRTGAAAFAEPTMTTLALPLVLSAALACGVRILITIPAEMNARWVFQTAAITPRVADAAAHKAVLLLVVPAVMATAAATAGLLWNAQTAVLHAIYCGALAILLCEILLISYRGIPLTRPYVPGGSRFHMLWAAYISAFLTYTLSSASFEWTLLRANGAGGVLKAAAVFVAIAAVIWARRKVRLRELEEVTFEAEVPDDETFKGFNLSEIDAAQAVAGRRRL